MDRKSGSFSLRASVGSGSEVYVETGIGIEPSGDKVFKVNRRYRTASGPDQYDVDRMPTTIEAGRLRLVRRGPLIATYFAEKIRQLKLPGVDPKEALAKLSEMEAALQAKQEQLADPSTEAALREIGDALSLAAPFQAAGEAMSQGEMEEAAEELAKLDMPKLDRQTERALTEKLDQARRNSTQGSQRRLCEAVSQVSCGLTQGDRSKFKRQSIRRYFEMIRPQDAETDAVLRKTSDAPGQ